MEAAWRVVDPALKGGLPLSDYDPGTWGPQAARKSSMTDDTWHDPQIEKSPPC